MLGAGEVNRAHLCLVSFFKAARQPLLPPVSPEAGCPCSPSFCPGLGEACRVGLSFAPASGSEGQMKEVGVQEGVGGVAMIPEPFYLVEANFWFQTSWKSQGGLVEGALGWLGVRTLPLPFVCKHDSALTGSGTSDI